MIESHNNLSWYGGGIHQLCEKENIYPVQGIFFQSNVVQCINFIIDKKYFICFNWNGFECLIQTHVYKREGKMH